LPQDQDRPVSPAIDWRTLRDKAHEIFASRREDYQAELPRKNDALIDSRIAGLRQTLEAKVARLAGQRDEATDFRIRRMRQSQPERVEDDANDKIVALEQRRVVSVGGDLVFVAVAKLVQALEPCPEVERRGGELTHIWCRPPPAPGPAVPEGRADGT
jgi:hypothetical protein